VKGTKDILIRDYAPLPIGLTKFVQFVYQPDYLQDGHENSITSPKVFQSLSFIHDRLSSRIILDGGNVVSNSRIALLTEKVFDENPDLTEHELESKLTKLLGVERLLFVPIEPSDDIGHSDGMVRFLDEQTVVVNDYRRMYRTFCFKLESAINKVGLRLTRLPYSPENKRFDGIWSAIGNYVNYLRVGNLIILPAFNRSSDEEARRLMQLWLPNAKVESLECRELARKGGVLNCATWTIQTRSAKK
jgi:agmatine/peptidylarginine deiminase